jgi:hypothetical protein
VPTRVGRPPLPRDEEEGVSGGMMTGEYLTTQMCHRCP